MAIIFSEPQDIYKFLQSKFNKIGDNKYELKEEEGEGIAHFYDFKNGQFIMYGEAKLRQPMLFRSFQRKTKEYGRTFSINYKETLLSEEEEEDKEYKYEEASSGVKLNSGHLDRQRIWLAKRKYRFLSFNFTESWLKKIGDSVDITYKLWDFIAKDDTLEVHIPSSSSTNQIVQQLFFRKENLITEAIEPFLQVKSFELIILTLSEYFNNLNGKNMREVSHPDDFKKIIELRDMLREKLYDLPSINEMAESLGMSRSKVQRSFKKIVGSSIFAYVLQSKMEKAFDMLIAHESVSNVAYSLGYSTVGNFTTAFKDYFNFLPSEIK